MVFTGWKEEGLFIIVKVTEAGYCIKCIVYMAHDSGG